MYVQSQQGRGSLGGGAIGGGDPEGWTVGPMHLFPRLASLLEGPGRTQSIA